MAPGGWVVGSAACGMPVFSAISECRSVFVGRRPFAHLSPTAWKHLWEGAGSFLTASNSILVREHIPEILSRCRGVQRCGMVAAGVAPARRGPVRACEGLWRCGLASVRRVTVRRAERAHGRACGGTRRAGRPRTVAHAADAACRQSGTGTGTGTPRSRPATGTHTACSRVQPRVARAHTRERQPREGFGFPSRQHRPPAPSGGDGRHEGGQADTSAHAAALLASSAALMSAHHRARHAPASAPGQASSARRCTPS